MRPEDPARDGIKGYLRFGAMIATATVVMYGLTYANTFELSHVRWSEHSETGDVRVCELAVAIIEAQRREIKEMEWLIADIEQNGVAATAAQAEQRPVPEFTGEAARVCG